VAEVAVKQSQAQLNLARANDAGHASVQKSFAAVVDHPQQLPPPPAEEASMRVNISRSMVEEIAVDTASADSVAWARRGRRCRGGDDRNRGPQGARRAQGTAGDGQRRW
jgi:hypothetical protein